MYNYYGDYFTTTRALDTTFENFRALGGLALVFFIILGLIGLAIIVFEIIATVKLFQKAGKPGWAAIVPFYNTVVLLEIIGFKWYYLFFVLLFTSPKLSCAALALFVEFVLSMKLAKAFGKKPGFGICLFFFSPVMIPVLAFSKDAKYKGPVVKDHLDFNNLF